MSWFRRKDNVRREQVAARHDALHPERPPDVPINQAKRSIKLVGAYIRRFRTPVPMEVAQQTTPKELSDMLQAALDAGNPIADWSPKAMTSIVNDRPITHNQGDPERGKDLASLARHNIQTPSRPRSLPQQTDADHHGSRALKHIVESEYYLPSVGIIRRYVRVNGPTVEFYQMENGQWAEYVRARAVQMGPARQQIDTAGACLPSEAVYVGELTDHRRAKREARTARQVCTAQRQPTLKAETGRIKQWPVPRIDPDAWRGMMGLQDRGETITRNLTRHWWIILFAIFWWALSARHTGGNAAAAFSLAYYTGWTIYDWNGTRATARNARSWASAIGGFFIYAFVIGMILQLLGSA